MTRKTLNQPPRDLPEKEATQSLAANRSVLLLLLALAAAALFIPEELNQNLFLSINKLTSQLPDSFWINITNLGSTLAGAALICLLLPKRPQLVLHLIISGLLCTLVVYGLKHSLDVIRPQLVLDRSLFHFIETNITSPARPSGHTATVFFIAGSAWLFLNGAASRIAVLLLALLIGLSRIAVGVHWPLDLIWGGFIGLAIGYGGAGITSRFIRKTENNDTDGKDLYLKGFTYLSLGAILFIAVYFIYNPLPYSGENIPSYVVIYVALITSAQGCFMSLKENSR